MADLTRYVEHNGRTYDMLAKEERKSFFFHRRQSREIEEDRKNKEAKLKVEENEDD